MWKQDFIFGLTGMFFIKFFLILSIVFTCDGTYSWKMEAITFSTDGTAIACFGDCTANVYIIASFR